MTCPDCMYGYCIGTNCDKAIAAFNEVSKAYPNLKGVWDKQPINSQDKNTGTGSNLAVAAAERQTVQER